jgi:hypothetical protein
MNWFQQLYRLIYMLLQGQTRIESQLEELQDGQRGLAEQLRAQSLQVSAAVEVGLTNKALLQQILATDSGDTALLNEILAKFTPPPPEPAGFMVVVTQNPNTQGD